MLYQDCLYICNKPSISDPILTILIMDVENDVNRAIVITLNTWALMPLVD